MLFGAISVAIYGWIFKPPPGSLSSLAVFAACSLIIGGTVVFVALRHVNRNCYWTLTPDAIVGRKDQRLIVNLGEIAEVSFVTLRQDAFRGWRVSAANRRAFNVLILKMRDGRSLPLLPGGWISGGTSGTPNFLKRLLVRLEPLLRDDVALSPDAQEFLRPKRLNDFCVIV
jgi:hypothetical protein